LINIYICIGFKDVSIFLAFMRLVDGNSAEVVKEAIYTMHLWHTGGKLVREWGVGSRDLESGERGFHIQFYFISYYCSQGDLLLWVIKMWTYKIVGGNIYYRGRINEYTSMVVGERIFYYG
jgi:hypothetical protein